MTLILENGTEIRQTQISSNIISCYRGIQYSKTSMQKDHILFNVLIKIIIHRSIYPHEIHFVCQNDIRKIHRIC